MIIFHSWIGFDPHRIWNFTLGNSVKIQESEVWKIETLGGVSKFRRRQTTVTDDGKVGGHGGVGHAQGRLGDLHGGGGEAGGQHDEHEEEGASSKEAPHAPKNPEAKVA